MDKCYYCEHGLGLDSNKRFLLKTRDHIIPLSKGGNSSHLNMVGACEQCNTLKGSKTPEVFSEFLLEEIEATKNGNGSSNRFTVLRLEVILINNNKLIEKIKPYRNQLFRSYIEPPKRSLVFEAIERQKRKADDEKLLLSVIPNDKVIPKPKLSVKERKKIKASPYLFSETVKLEEWITKYDAQPHCSFHY